MLAFHGVGAVLGPLIGNALGVRDARTLHRAIGVGFLLIPLGWLIIGAAAWLPLVLVGSTLRGMGGSANWTYSDVLLQMRVPDRYLGRVFALDFAIFTLAMSASVWLGGLALDRFALDPRGLVMIFAAGSLGPAIAWIAALRRRERYPAQPVATLVDA
jgi:MFS family permease